MRKVLAQYPRDRVALNDLGRILFLQRKYADAVKVLQSVLAIDPEDLQAHYNLMLCYNGLGDEKRAHEHQARYLRFKADERLRRSRGRIANSIPKTTMSGRDSRTRVGATARRLAPKRTAATAANTPAGGSK